MNWSSSPTAQTKKQPTVTGVKYIAPVSAGGRLRLRGSNAVVRAVRRAPSAVRRPRGRSVPFATSSCERSPLLRKVFHNFNRFSQAHRRDSDISVYVVLPSSSCDELGDHFAAGNAEQSGLCDPRMLTQMCNSWPNAVGGGGG